MKDLRAAPNLSGLLARASGEGQQEMRMTSIPTSPTLADVKRLAAEWGEEVWRFDENERRRKAGLAPLPELELERSLPSGEGR